MGDVPPISKKIVLAHLPPMVTRPPRDLGVLDIREAGLDLGMAQMRDQFFQFQLSTLRAAAIVAVLPLPPSN